MASTAVSTVAWPVIITTSEGTPAALICLRISRPDTPGIMRSSKITSNWPVRAEFKPCARIVEILDFVPGGAQGPAATDADDRLVVDHGDAERNGLGLIGTHSVITVHVTTKDTNTRNGKTRNIGRGLDNKINYGSLFLFVAISCSFVSFFRVFRVFRGSISVSCCAGPVPAG